MVYSRIYTLKSAKGAQFLRNLVLWLNDRNEYNNYKKSVPALIKEYKRYLNTLLPED